MKSFLQENKSNNDGFQGCSNIKNCGFDGFYLCKYSPEGLCNGCEKKFFPDRFHGCIFCRSPVKSYYGLCSDTCSSCRNDFPTWVYQNTSFASDRQKFGFDKSACDLCNTNNKTHHKFILSNNQCNKWPGFYCGENKWIIPKLTIRETTKEVTRENCSQLLLELLEANGIHIYEEIQYTLIK